MDEASTTQDCFTLFTGTLKPQLDHDEPSYQAALARMERAPPGATLHPEGALPTMHVIEPPRPVLPDPPGRPRAASPRLIARGVGHRAAPDRQRAMALLADHGRPGIASEIALGDEAIVKALANARHAGIVKTRQVRIAGIGGTRSMYALPSWPWPDRLPDGWVWIDQQEEVSEHDGA